MLSIFDIAKLIKDPSGLPAMVLATMPGMGFALARMGAAQLIAERAAELAQLSTKAVIFCASQKRDLNPDERHQLDTLTRAVMAATRTLLEVHNAPAVDLLHLADAFGLHNGKGEPEIAIVEIDRHPTKPAA